MSKMNTDVFAQYLNRYGKGKIEADVIQGLYNDGEIDNEDLKKFYQKKTFADNVLKSFGKSFVENLHYEGLIEKDKFDALYPPPSPEEQKRALELGIVEGRYTDDEIIGFVESGMLEKHELTSKFLISDEKARVLFPEAIEVDFGNWKDVPDTLEEGRVDVFVLGMAGSGKSCFMAGLLYYADNIGKLDANIDNIWGLDYVNTLIEAVDNGAVPPPTSVEYIQYMACDFKNTSDERVKHPLTFIEMSGEIFQNTYAKKMDEMPTKFRKYLFENPNRKYIFLTVDYAMGNNIKQKKNFEYLLKFLAGNGTMDTVEGIVLIITKWDGTPEDIESQANDFLQKSYLSLINKCEEFVEEFDLSFHVYKFSLGDFNHPKSYNYVPDDSAEIFNLLCQTTTGIEKTKKKRKKKRLSFW